MKKLLIFSSLLLIAFIIVVLFNQENILNPKRRVLQDYHYEWLNHPKQHSMKIVKVEAHPEILIVEFDKDALLSKRAKKIKDELLAIGYRESDLEDNGIIILFHGKNGRKEDLLPVAERYVTAGFSCILVDLPNHGESPKKQLFYTQGDEKNFYEEVLAMAENKIEVKDRPLYVWGMSLGGAFAIASALPKKSDFQAPKALVLVSTFDKLSYVLEEQSVKIFGDYLGKAFYKTLHLSLKYFYNFEPEQSDSAKRARSIGIPIFMLHGKKDELIGYKHGERLFKSFSSKKKEFHLDNNGDHHNILVTEYPFYLKSIAFLLKLQKYKG